MRPPKKVSTGHRKYSVWVKGNKASTQTVVEGKDKGHAIWEFSKKHDLEREQCDAVWIKNDQ